IEISVSKPARSPVLPDDDIARLRRKVRMPVTAPFAARESVALHDGLLARARMVPVIIVAWFPAPMRHDEHLDARGSHRAPDGTQIVEKMDALGDLLDSRPQLAALRQEVVVGIDEKERGLRAIIGWRDHDAPLVLECGPLDDGIPSHCLRPRAAAGTRREPL